MVRVFQKSVFIYITSDADFRVFHLENVCHVTSFTPRQRSFKYTWIYHVHRLDDGFGIYVCSFVNTAKINCRSCDLIEIVYKFIERSVWLIIISCIVFRCTIYFYTREPINN